MEMEALKKINKIINKNLKQEQENKPLVVLICVR